MKTLLCVFVLLCCATFGLSQTPSDVPDGHWAYDAVESLMEKGYVQGYPDGTFRGGQSMTRYEFAVVVARLVEGVNDAIQEGISGIPPTGGTTTPPATGTTNPSAGQVTKEDLATLQKLIDEFKVELTVIGTRLDTIEANMGALSAKVKDMDSVLNDEEGAFQTVRADVSKLKKIGISGYVQARYQLIDRDQDKGTPVIDQFSIRRARIKVTASPTMASQAVIQLDMGGNAVTIKDAFLQFCPLGNTEIGYSARFGQMNWWFGYEVPYSSSSRETPERALIFQRLFPGERDKGLVISSPTAQALNWTLGVYNGSGANANDVNDDKDFLANVKYAKGDLNIGVSGYLGKMNSVSTFTNVPRDKVRYGGDIQYYWNALTFKGEWVRGKGIEGYDARIFAPDQWISGGYGQVAFQINRNYTAVAKYFTMTEDPKFPGFEKRTGWDLGAIRWLDDNTRLKVFYQINKEEVKEFDNDLLTFEWLTKY